MKGRSRNEFIQKALSLGTAGLRGPAALHHDVVQLLSVEDDGEEVDLPIRFCLRLLCTSHAFHAVQPNRTRRAVQDVPGRSHADRPYVMAVSRSSMHLGITQYQEHDDQNLHRVQNRQQQCKRRASP